MSGHKSCWDYIPCLITHINPFHHVLRETYEFFLMCCC